LDQGCPNHTFGGVFYTPIWGTSSWSMTLIFSTQVEEVKIGPRNFLGVRIFSDGFKTGLQRKNFIPGLWATKKTYKYEISQGASHHQYRTSEFYSSSLVNWLSFYLKFYRKNLEFPTFYDSPSNNIFHRFQENISSRMKYKKLSFHCLLLNIHEIYISGN
jgi:hypothetical protein